MTELLNKLVTDKRKLYKAQLIRFPAPKFFVLYNGNEFEPVEKIMRLSDAKRAWQEEAREQESENFAVKLIRRGSPFDEIHELTELSLQRIQELANEKRDR